MRYTKCDLLVTTNEVVSFILALISVFVAAVMSSYPYKSID